MQLFVVPWTPGPLLSIAREPAQADPFEPSPWLGGILFAVALVWIISYIIICGYICRLPTWLLVPGVPGVLHLVVVLVLAGRHDCHVRLENNERDRVMRDALLLDPSDPDVLALIVVYREVTVSSRLPEVTEMADAALSAAHAALIETAMLLNGEPAAADPERNFVQERVSALADMASALRRRHRAAVEAAAREAHATQERERKARLEAIAEVYEQDQGGSLARLAALREELDLGESDTQ